MRLLRDSILLFGLLLIAPWRSRSRRHFLRIWQVFTPCDDSEPRILVHAVSLGEVNASARLVRELQEFGLD
ncbi:MAG: glycosyltransferase N-terminal domain-containing protein, partial [Planctomycetota bacterium]